MTSAFLQLPIEIRELIYDYCLVANSGFVSPTVCKSIDYRRPHRRYTVGNAPAVKSVRRLHLVPYSPPSLDDNAKVVNFVPLCQCSASCGDGRNPSCRPIIHNIHMVCKQTRDETIARKWTTHTLFFRRPDDIAPVFRHMGQVLSRQYQAIRIAVRFDEAPNDAVMAQCISKILSRHRHGLMGRLEIVLTNFSQQFEDLSKKSYVLFHRYMWEFISALDKLGRYVAWPTCGFKRVLIITAPRVGELRDRPKPFHPLSPDHMCWEVVRDMARIWNAAVEINGKKW